MHAAIATYVATQHEQLWINADECKPPLDVEVLIAFRDFPLPATGQYTASDNDIGGWSFPDENDPKVTGPVTHWLPLPRTPYTIAEIMRQRKP
jgi:hypothetical protein